jgi:hypothetical protein
MKTYCGRDNKIILNEYILQTCREKIWPLPTTLQEKLYGPVDTLQKITRFVAETEIQV